MNIQAKDVIHLYIGCRCIYNNKKYILTGVKKPYLTNNKRLIDIVLRPDGKGFMSSVYMSSIPEENIDEIKLELRPLSSMTEEDAFNLGWEKGFESVEEFFCDFNGTYSCNDFLYLLKQGFDIFNLHKSGQCIYKEDLV